MKIGELNFRNALALSNNHSFYSSEIFDFTSTYAYRPFAMLFIASLMRTIKVNNATKQLYLRCIIDNKNTSYAGHMGFYKSISKELPIGKMPGEAVGSNTYLPITLIEFNKLGGVNVELQLEKKSIQLAKILVQNTNYKLYSYVIREILRNSLEHSEKKQVWICAQYWKTYGFTEIAILDEGIGIKNSLLSNHNFKDRISNDVDAIKMSVMPGISEAYGRKSDWNDTYANSGYGLYVVLELCKKLGGNLLIASGNTAIFYSSDSVELFDINFQGTAIRILFPNNNKYKDEMITEIVRNAEKKVINLKQTIKHASKTSITVPEG